jgi:hypothetical protein
MTPKIRVIYQAEPFSPEPWTAFDENDLADGWNGPGRLHPLGIGKTQEDAIQDLLRQLTEEGETC